MRCNVDDYVYIRVRNMASKFLCGYGRIRGRYFDGSGSDYGFTMDVIANDGLFFESLYVSRTDILHKVTDKVHIVELKLRGL